MTPDKAPSQKELIRRERKELNEFIDRRRDQIEELRRDIKDRRRETQEEIAEIRERFGEADELSEEGAAFIASHEGIVLHGYNDPVGHCTIGVGHLLHYGNCTAAELNKRLTRQEAFDLLRRDVGVYVAAVKRLIEPELTQPRLDALTSFTFNNGVGALEDSTLRRRFNRGEDPEKVVREELPKWVKAGNPPRTLPGLVSRRNAEVKLFTTGRYA